MPSAPRRNLAAALHPSYFAVRAHDPVFLLEGVGCALNGGLIGVAKPRAVFGVDKAQDLIGRAGKVLGGTPIKAIHRLRPGDPIGRQIALPHPQPRRGQHERQPLQNEAKFRLF